MMDFLYGFIIASIVWLMVGVVLTRRDIRQIEAMHAQLDDLERRMPRS